MKQVCLRPEIPEFECFSLQHFLTTFDSNWGEYRVFPGRKLDRDRSVTVKVAVCNYSNNSRRTQTGCLRLKLCGSGRKKDRMTDTGWGLVTTL